MSKDTKQRMIAQYSDRFRGVEDCVVLNYQGLSSERVGDLRKSLRKERASMCVVRNSLVLKAFDKMGRSNLTDFVRGPAALAYGEDAVAVARALYRWIGEAGDGAKIQVLGGTLGGKVMAPDQVQALSKLPDRKTMLAEILATVMAPASVIAHLLSNTLTQVPYLVQNHVEQKGKEGAQETQPAANAAAGTAA